eukprot:6485873-Amphidinium_carterae.1
MRKQEVLHPDLVTMASIAPSSSESLPKEASCRSMLLFAARRKSLKLLPCYPQEAQLAKGVQHTRKNDEVIGRRYLPLFQAKRGRRVDMHGQHEALK